MGALLAGTRLPRRWILRTRRLWKVKLRKPSAGSTRIQRRKKRNTKKSKRNSKVLPCPFSKRWEVEHQEACPVECPVECLTWVVWAVCLVRGVRLQLMTPQEVLPLKKSIKRFARLLPRVFP